MKLYGIYHANGGLGGEIVYLFGKLMGTAHCALCDITHGVLLEKKEFRTCHQRWEIPFEKLHLNEQKHTLAEFTKGHTPCVVLEENENHFVFALGAEALESCRGDVTCFETKLKAFLAQRTQ